MEAAIKDRAQIIRPTDKAPPPDIDHAPPAAAPLSSPSLSMSNELRNEKKRAHEDSAPSMSPTSSNTTGPLTHTLANTTIPPTLREILQAYGMHDEANKDRGMLLDILRAKSAEDHRIAALANVQLIQLQASLLQFHTALSNATNSATSGSNGSGSGNGSGLGGGSKASPLEVLAMLSADASARENSHAARSPLVLPHGFAGSASHSQSQSQSSHQARPRSHASSSSAKRLSPPISHISSDISGESFVAPRKKNSHISPPPPQYSQSKQSSTERRQPPSSPKGMTSKPGSATASPAAPAAPVLSRKPLAHLLAPLPTSSVLYPSRRNPQPATVTAAAPSMSRTSSSGSSIGVSKMELVEERKGKNQDDDSVPASDGAVVLSATQNRGTATPVDAPIMDSTSSTGRGHSMEDGQSRSRRRAEALIEGLGAEMDIDPPRAPEPLVKGMGAFVIIDGVSGSG